MEIRLLTPRLSSEFSIHLFLGEQYEPNKLNSTMCQNSTQLRNCIVLHYFGALLSTVV